MGKKIRVAQVLNRMDSGGIETVVVNYFRHIDRERFRFDFFYDESSEMPCREELLKLGAGLFPLPGYTHQRDYQAVLERELKARGYDIAHVHMNAMSVFALRAAKKAGIPVRICHNHSTASAKEGIRTALKVALRPWNRAFATDYFACGEQAGEWMFGHRTMEEGKVFLLPNAIDAAKYLYREENRRAVRAELGIAEDTFVVGHIGRFMKQKNHEYLLRVFQELCGEKENAVLLLVGEGKRESEIRQKVKELGIEDRVIFAGVREDTGRVYSAMDVFCLPSFYEGFPVVLLEAQANGLPVVCSDRVSEEVCLTEGITRLPLGEGGQWVAAVKKAERKPGRIPDRFEIRNAAKLLEVKYTECAANRALRE